MPKNINRVSNPYLRRIATGTLGATEGYQASPFEVFELIKDGQFQQIFGGFGVELDKLAWTQDQIIKFFEDHSELLPPKSRTFFLFKVGLLFFVVGLDRYDSIHVQARAYCLLRNDVWNVNYCNRFVIPQLIV